MQPIETIERLVQDIVKGMVNQPEQVETYVTNSSDEQGELIVINVKLAKPDFGVCIGQKGTTAEAIRKVIGLVGFKQLGQRVYTKIDAPRVPRNHFDYQKS